MEEYENLLLCQLQSECKNRNLRTAGLKVELISRLCAHDYETHNSDLDKLLEGYDRFNDRDGKLRTGLIRSHHKERLHLSGRRFDAEIQIHKESLEKARKLKEEDAENISESQKGRLGSLSMALTREREQTKKEEELRDLAKKEQERVKEEARREEARKEEARKERDRKQMARKEEAKKEMVRKEEVRREDARLKEEAKKKEEQSKREVELEKSKRKLVETTPNNVEDPDSATKKRKVEDTGNTSSIPTRPKYFIESDAILPMLRNRAYIFIAARDLMVRTDTMRRLDEEFRRYRGVREICADRSGYFINFGSVHSADDWAKECFYYSEGRFNGRFVRMELTLKSGELIRR